MDTDCAYDMHMCVFETWYFYISRNIDIIWIMQLIHLNCGGALAGSVVFIGSSFSSCPQCGPGWEICWTNNMVMENTEVIVHGAL